MKLGIGLGIPYPNGINGFSPASLFAAGEQGVWYDPSDMSTLFQDAAGTVPVTGVEQPVGLMLDKSGRGNHASQDTTTKRPVLEIDVEGCYYLSFDGVDDVLQTGDINFADTNKMTVWLGAEFPQTAGGILHMLLNHNTTGSNSFRVILPNGASATLGITFTGDGPGLTNTILGYPVGVYRRVIAVDSDLSSSKLTTRVDGKQASTASGSADPVSRFANTSLWIGSQTGGVQRFFNGNLYSLIVRGAQTPLSQIEAAEAYTKQKMRMP